MAEVFLKLVQDLKLGTCLYVFLGLPIIQLNSKLFRKPKTLRLQVSYKFKMFLWEKTAYLLKWPKLKEVEARHLICENNVHKE